MARRITIQCPECGAAIEVDVEQGTAAHIGQKTAAKDIDLSQASDWLKDEATRRDQNFERARQAERDKAARLGRKFEEGLRQAKEQPPTRPLRDLDLD